jgi:hypothetical protein
VPQDRAALHLDDDQQPDALDLEVLLEAEGVSGSFDPTAFDVAEANARLSTSVLRIVKDGGRTIAELW